jgi:hypothetical protein
MEKVEITHFLYGGVAMASGVAGLFFLKFWQKTRDRFFALFSAAFFLLAIERLFFLFIQAENEVHTYVFIFRLLAFVLIMAAVVDKNRS